MKVYALRCIRLTNYCPYLINIPHGPDGYTPFHKVCFHGNTCLIEYMLAKGKIYNIKYYYDVIFNIKNS